MSGLNLPIVTDLPSPINVHLNIPFLVVLVYRLTFTPRYPSSGSRFSCILVPFSCLFVLRPILIQTILLSSQTKHYTINLHYHPLSVPSRVSPTVDLSPPYPTTDFPQESRYRFVFFAGPTCATNEEHKSQPHRVVLDLLRAKWFQLFLLRNDRLKTRQRPTVYDSVCFSLHQ